MPSPYFALYPTDFLADVGHLGNTELGIYWRLLLVYYRDGRPLPFDTDRLRRLAMAFSPEEYRALDAVVSEFFVLSTEPDGTRAWRHKRADRELAAASDRHAGAKRKASEAAKARWSKSTTKPEPDAASNAPSNAPSMPEAMLQLCHPEPEPYTNTNPPIPPKGGRAAVSFKAWADAERKAGRSLVPDDDPVIAYADEVGIPQDFLALAWQEFKVRYTQPDAKRYKDWRAVFRKAVRGNWMRLWILDGTGYRLSTVGEQARRVAA